VNELQQHDVIVQIQELSQLYIRCQLQTENG